MVDLTLDTKTVPMSNTPAKGPGALSVLHTRMDSGSGRPKLVLFVSITFKSQ